MNMNITTNDLIRDQAISLLDVPPTNVVQKKDAAKSENGFVYKTENLIVAGSTAGATAPVLPAPTLPVTGDVTDEIIASFTLSSVEDDQFAADSVATQPARRSTTYGMPVLDSSMQMFQMLMKLMSELQINAQIVKTAAVERYTVAVKAQASELRHQGSTELAKAISSGGLSFGASAWGAKQNVSGTKMELGAQRAKEKWDTFEQGQMKLQSNLDEVHMTAGSKLDVFKATNPDLAQALNPPAIITPPPVATPPVAIPPVLPINAPATPPVVPPGANPANPPANPPGVLPDGAVAALPLPSAPVIPDGAVGLAAVSVTGTPVATGALAGTTTGTVAAPTGTPPPADGTGTGAQTGTAPAADGTGTGGQTGTAPADGTGAGGVPAATGLVGTLSSAASSASASLKARYEQLVASYETRVAAAGQAITDHQQHSPAGQLNGRYNNVDNVMTDLQAARAAQGWSQAYIHGVAPALSGVATGSSEIVIKESEASAAELSASANIHNNVVDQQGQAASQDASVRDALLRVMSEYRSAQQSANDAIASNIKA